ncbi:MAG: hypothetical protein JXQ76_12710 [Campylobacterales bacterium]|nr:hypothetical protein [Campylobacterales bacterium]
MKKLMLLVFFAYMLQGCGSTSAKNETNDTQTSKDAYYACITTPNLQLGERVTYRFDVKGEISYLSAEVVDEDNQSYTIAFEENQKIEYYSWLKDCQTSEILSEIYKDAKKTIS